MGIVMTKKQVKNPTIQGERNVPVNLLRSPLRGLSMKSQEGNRATKEEEEKITQRGDL